MPNTIMPYGGSSTVTVVNEPQAIAYPVMPVLPPPVRAEARISTLAVGINEGPRLDPRLQKLVAVQRSGGTTLATASSAPGEVAVLARVTDPEAWEGLSEVRPGLSIPPAPGSEGTIVTGRIPLSRIENVRGQPFVLSLKAAQDLRPELSFGIVETHAAPEALPADVTNRGGKDVVVGIIDFGCDFAHQNFIVGGTSRIEAIWHQGGVTSASAPFGYGALYEQAAINAALLKPDPYAGLAYPVPRDSGTSIGTHGTHVMDIAAGGGGSGVSGFAPEATIIFVDASTDDIAWSKSGVVGSSFGDSVRLLEAVKFIFDRAGDRPCVINISLGTNGGPHDGSTLVERGIDDLIQARPNRAVVIAASNSYADHVHASHRIGPGEQLDLKWNRPPGSGWQDELEIWYPGSGRISAEILFPDGRSAGVVGPGQTGQADNNGQIVLMNANRLNDPNNSDNTIGIFVDDSLPSGLWTIRLTASTMLSTLDVHAWIERDDNSQASFASNVDDDFTIGSISCGRNSLVVGSYDAHKPTTPLSYFSSAGPTRDGRPKPELSAPGHSVHAARSRTRTGVTVKSGTSMAAPAVTGSLALLFGEAQVRGIDLDIATVRRLLLTSARSQSSGNWDPRWGTGKLDVAALLGLLPLGAAAASPIAAAPSKPKKGAPRTAKPKAQTKGSARRKKPAK